MRDLEILSRAIERRKEASGKSYLDEGEELSSAKAVEDMAAEIAGTKDDGEIPLREDQKKDIPDVDDIDDGLAPRTAKEAMSDDDDDDEEKGEDYWAEEAEKALGRKPMSTVKSSKNSNSSMNFEQDELDEKTMEAMDQMSDKRLQDQLKAGRKPTRLRDKVQLNIMEMQKNKK